MDDREMWFIDVDKDPKMQTGILSEMSEECHSFWAEKSKNVDFGSKWLIIYKIIDTDNDTLGTLSSLLYPYLHNTSF